MVVFLSCRILLCHDHEHHAVEGLSFVCRLLLHFFYLLQASFVIVCQKKETGNGISYLLLP